MFIIAATFTIYEACADEFRRAILENAATSMRDEEGCLTFDVCEAAADPVFFLYEKYASEDAFKLHLASAHFLSFNRASQPWVREKKVERYSLLNM
ncbi:putative quinol monooxygenase [Candidimonas nitroreducens]|uniref:Antibiotic biosynthesis monooxygenase n=1 Tax=Candidimonas nitroreducens TaxID=683354 RepID=A0A225MD12_9BURK|nr:putative quinol monooxygenase [Candidimonas nitroreducens]OWT56859.1 antibiotic biosynthesis monooxygenase [Candidimonas nitroreducens]